MWNISIFNWLFINDSYSIAQTIPCFVCKNPTRVGEPEENSWQPIVSTGLGVIILILLVCVKICWFTNREKKSTPELMPMINS